MTIQFYWDKILKIIRHRFFEEYSYEHDLFDEVDILRLQVDDWYITRFSLTEKNSYKAMIESMIYLKKNDAYQISPGDIPIELFQQGEMEDFGRDKCGRYIIWHYNRVKTQFHNKEFDKYTKMGYVHFNLFMDKVSHKHGCTIISRVDFAFRKENLSLFFEDVKNFPLKTRRIIFVDASKVTQIMLKTMNHILGGKVEYHFISAKNLTRYVNFEFIPREFGGNHLYEVKIPPEAKPLRELIKPAFSESEIA